MSRENNNLHKSVSIELFMKKKKKKNVKKQNYHFKEWIRVMVFKATFNNISAISWRAVLLVEETSVPRENQRF